MQYASQHMHSQEYAHSNGMYVVGCNHVNNVAKTMVNFNN